MSDKPIMCTLGKDDFKDREAAWHAVLGRSVTGWRETTDGFELSIARDEGTLEEINRLAALESDCCSWMEIAVEDGDPVLLTISSKSPGGKAVIGMLLPDA